MWRPPLIAGLGVLAVLALVLIVTRGGADTALTEDGEEIEIPFRTAEWGSTDFTSATVPLDEFISGGPPKDGIPSIDDPKFESIDEADEWLAGNEPVAVVERNDDVRAYPLSIMTQHEIVNDVIGGESIAVTYCPLCNSTVAFSRELDGEAVEFGTTGMLRKSDLVMYDRRTESWWQQLTADAVVGELAGERLEVVPSQILSWREFKRLHPSGESLSRDTGFNRTYGRNPYAFYDSAAPIGTFLGEEPDDALPAMERVSAIKLDEGRGAVVYPFARLADDAPINDEADGRELVVFYDPNVGSALDAAEISEGRDVGASAVFERQLDGRTLTFAPGPDPQSFRDAETGSTWAMSGEAIDGQLEGARLEQVPHDDSFWFAIAAFVEDPDIRD